MRVALVVTVVVLALAAAGFGLLRNDGDDARAAGRSPAASPVALTPSTAAGPTGPASSTASPTVVAKPSPRPKTPARGSHQTAAPVALDQDATPLPEVSATLASVRQINATSELPGETSGPAIELVVEVKNGTAKPVDLSGGVVNLYLGKDRKPAVPIDSTSHPWPVTVAAGHAERGTFVFRLPPGAGRRIVAEVDLGAASTVVLFRGPRPRSNS